MAVHVVNRPEEQPVHHGPVGVRDPPHLPDALKLSGRGRLPVEQTHEMSWGVQVGSKSEAESRRSLLGLQKGCPKKSPLAGRNPIRVSVLRSKISLFSESKDNTSRVKASRVRSLFSGNIQANVYSPCQPKSTFSVKQLKRSYI